MNIPGSPRLIREQMDAMIIGAACDVNMAVAYEETISDDAKAVEFHERVTREFIYELGYCLGDRFGDGDGAWAVELAAEVYPVRWWRRALALGFIPVILRERQGYPPFADSRTLAAYARHEHFAFTDLLACRHCRDYTIHRVTEFGGRCLACNTLRPPPDFDVIFMHPREG